jgi:hypothetical protein
MAESLISSALVFLGRSAGAGLKRGALELLIFITLSSVEGAILTPAGRSRVEIRRDPRG